MAIYLFIYMHAYIYPIGLLQLIILDAESTGLHCRPTLLSVAGLSRFRDRVNDRLTSLIWLLHCRSV